MAGERNTLKKDKKNLCYYIKHLRQRNKQGKKILRGNFFLSSRVTHHQQVGYRESCVYYTKKVNVVRRFQRCVVSVIHGKELKTFPVVRIFLDLAGLEF